MIHLCVWRRVHCLAVSVDVTVTVTVSVAVFVTVAVCVSEAVSLIELVLTEAFSLLAAPLRRASLVIPHCSSALVPTAEFAAPQ